MKYLIDPGSLANLSNDPNCRKKGGTCQVVCFLCGQVCNPVYVPLYGIDPEPM